MIHRFARPYAQAFLSTVGPLAAAEAARAELGLFAEALHQVPQLAAMAANPAVPPELKRSVLDQVCDVLGTSAHPRRLLRLLTDNYRLVHLDDILAVIDELLDRRRGIVTAQVKTAIRASEEEVSRLHQALRRALAADVRLDVSEAPEILGGFVARVGSYRYDVSLKGQLDRLSAQLAGAGLDR